MTKEHPKDNKGCKSDEHTKHLCYFISYGYHITNADDYRGMTEEPKFKCYICGRLAHCAESLCDPMNL